MVEHAWTNHGKLEIRVGTRYLASDVLRQKYYEQGAAFSNDEAKRKSIPLEVGWVNDDIKYGVRATARITPFSWASTVGYKGSLINKELMEARSKEEEELVKTGRISKTWRCDVYFMQLTEDRIMDGSDPFTNPIAWAINSALSPKTRNAEYVWDLDRLSMVTHLYPTINIEKGENILVFYGASFGEGILTKDLRPNEEHETKNHEEAIQKVISEFDLPDEDCKRLFNTERRAPAPPRSPSTPRSPSPPRAPTAPTAPPAPVLHKLRRA
jgi:hypothetical protein